MTKNFENKKINQKVVIIANTSKYLFQYRLLLINKINALYEKAYVLSPIDKYSKIADIGFDTCHYFYDPNIAGLVKNINIENQTYICYDYIGFHKGGKHEIDYITTDDDFVSQIWFYSSDRICGNTGVKDACVLSKLTSEQLSDFSYSQTMSKFKALSIMYDNEMKGPLSGYTSKGTPRYSKFKTSLIGREKRLHCPEWVPSLNVKMPEEKEGTLIEMLKEIDLARYSL